MYKKNIVIDIRLIDTDSGIATYINSIIHKIIKQFADCKFYLLSNSKKLLDEDFNKKNIDLIYISSQLYTIKEQYEILIKSPKKIDLYWSPHYVFPVLINAKLLVTIHDVNHIINADLSIIQKIYSRIIFYFISRKANKVITVSEFSKKEIANHTSVDINKVDVIYNGVELGDHVNKDDCIYKNKFILFVGNLKKHKNVKNLIKAYNKIENMIEEDLIIIGYNNKAKNIDYNSLKVINENPRIKLYNNMKRENLIKYYQNASLLVFPSFYEGFGLPPLEAIACNCPVIASDIDSIKEICKNSVIYCNPNSSIDISKKIISVVGDTKLKNNLIHKAKKILKLYSWDKSAKQHSLIIKEII